MELTPVDNFDQVIKDALDENSITPLVKLELASKVRQRRRMTGQEDVVVTFEPPKVYELSEQEKYKIELRKRRNRHSAEIARKKRKATEENLEKECSTLEDQHRSLQTELQKLKAQVKEYKKVLFTHQLLSKTGAVRCGMTYNRTHIQTLVNT